MPILGGAISSSFISVIVMWVKKYKPIILWLMLLSVISTVLFYPACMSKSIGLVYLCAGALGLFLVPLVPVSLELSCEIIYPINGSFAVGILYSGATLLTVISSQLLTIIVKGEHSTEHSVLVTTIVLICILGFGFLIFLPVSEVRNR